MAGGTSIMGKNTFSFERRAGKEAIFYPKEKGNEPAPSLFTIRALNHKQGSSEKRYVSHTWKGSARKRLPSCGRKTLGESPVGLLRNYSKRRGEPSRKRDRTGRNVDNNVEKERPRSLAPSAVEKHSCRGNRLSRVSLG